MHRRGCRDGGQEKEWGSVTQLFRPKSNLSPGGSARAEQLSLGVTFVRGHVRTGRSEKSHSTTLRNSGSRQDDKDRFAIFHSAACKQGLCATKQNSRARKLGSFFQPGHFFKPGGLPQEQGSCLKPVGRFPIREGRSLRNARRMERKAAASPRPPRRLLHGTETKGFPSSSGRGVGHPVQGLREFGVPLDHRGAKPYSERVRQLNCPTAQESEQQILPPLL